MTDQNDKNNSFVSMVEDPYGLKTLEVADAQNNSEELDLQEIDEESDAIDISSLCASAEEVSEEAELEAVAAENSESEIIESPEEPIADLNPEQLDRLAQAIAEVEAEVEAAAEAVNSDEDDEAQAAAQLAAEIAEDEALAKQLEEEAALAEEMDPELQAALPKAPETVNGELDLREMESCIEALLFMTDKPMSVEKLQNLLGPDFSLSIFQEAMTSLRDRYNANHHGIEIVEVGGGYQFRTKPGRAALARKLAKVQTQRLSSGAMESLAIVAYRQPVMKEDIDKIRGVDSSYFIRNLLDKKLIQISGRSDLPGRPMLYSTTSEFLELFSLKDLSSMPPLHEIEKMIPSSQTTNPDEEDPRVKEMRRLVSQMKSDTSTNLMYNPREDEKILKEIRERVNAIPTSTPYLEEQKDLEKQAAIAAQQPAEEPAPGTQLPLEAEQIAVAPATASAAAPAEAPQLD